MLQESSTDAIDRACSGSSVVSICTAIIARSSRPAALIRGARPKPTIPAVNRFLSSEPLTSIRARRPTLGPGGDRRQAMPDDDSILIRKRHDVGDGRQRDQTQRADQKVAKMRRRALAVAE